MGFIFHYAAVEVYNLLYVGPVMEFGMFACRFYAYKLHFSRSGIRLS